MQSYGYFTVLSHFLQRKRQKIPINKYLLPDKTSDFVLLNYLSCTFEFHSKCFTFCKVQANSPLLSLHQHFFAVDDVESLGWMKDTTSAEVIDRTVIVHY